MTKERLKNYVILKEEREQLRRQLDELEATLYYPRIQRLSDMPSVPSKENTLELMVGRHLELQSKYEAKIAEMTAEMLLIEEAIEKLDPTARMLLRYRYIEGLKWEEVCVRINYSWMQTHRIHAHALNQLNSGELTA
jgi:DNA-directed RNA polymerase specialized sigma subunit